MYIEVLIVDSLDLRHGRVNGVRGRVNTYTDMELRMQP